MINRSKNLDNRLIDVLPDSADFRDLIYRPALIQIKREIIPDKELIRIRDQGKEGACTGFGLAAVIDFLNLLQARSNNIDKFEKVSTRMLYELARHYDRWPGEEYEGSSARGAMKGWHKHGVCGEDDWPYRPGKPGSLTAKRQERALQNPLGAYYRVLPRRTDLQAALNEVGAIFVTAKVHRGWRQPIDGIIQYDKDTALEPGGHAFAIVGYNDTGFIIQNSWGKKWGGVRLNGDDYLGLAIWAYEDFDKNLMDAWVARMSRPVTYLSTFWQEEIVQTQSGPKRILAAPPSNLISHHYIHIDEGFLDPQGNYPSDRTQVREIVKAASQADHVLLYAHGGLNDVKGAAKRVAAWRNVFERNGIYDIHFLWESGLEEELVDILSSKLPFVTERVGGAGDWQDRVLEKVTWPLGRPLWKEMLSDTRIAFEAKLDGDRPAGSETLDLLKEIIDPQKTKLHMVGHSAGAIWLAHLLQRWHALHGPAFENLILFAPACTHSLFESQIVPRIKERTIENFSQFILDDATEQSDDVGLIYRKSLLYLVSNSYQKRKLELIGPLAIPLLGMERFISHLDPIIQPIKDRVRTFITGQNPETTSNKHGEFDNDPATMNTMLKLIVGSDNIEAFQKEDLEGY